MVSKFINSHYTNAKWFIIHSILHADDTPHKIALGAAIGLFIAWSPALGLHMLMALTLCVILRANKFVALIAVWICNPLTFIPIYLPSYILGKNLLSVMNIHTQQLSTEQFQKIFQDFLASAGPTASLSPDFWKRLTDFLIHVGLQLSIGATIIGLVVAIAGYFTTRTLIAKYRKKHPIEILLQKE